MLFDRRHFWKLHGAWLVVTAAATLAAAAWPLAAFRATGRWPGGGSLPGLMLGLLAAAIFLLETALVLKKTRWFRTARWTLSAQTWMKAHIWLGLLTVPLVVLHSGGRLGGTLTTVLLGVYAVVIASGVWGLALQNYLPRMLLESAPAETIYSQIDAVGRQFAAEARRLVLLHCGDAGQEPVEEPLPVAAVAAADNVWGARRSVGPPVAHDPHPEANRPRPIASPPVQAALDETIGPYLLTGESPRALLGTSQRNRFFFDDLRLRVAPQLRGLVGQLEDLCERRRQLNVQKRLHYWLHNWLWLHLPLSVALLVLLVGHVVFALRFG